MYNYVFDIIALINKIISCYRLFVRDLELDSATKLENITKPY